MPYRMMWVPAPQDTSIPVLKEKPDKSEGPSYHCPFCKGWIKGTCNSFQEDTLAPCAGRKGTVIHCIRCGVEVDFFGMCS